MSTTNNPFIACCGLDCEACEARLATISNDNALRAKVAEEWSKTFAYLFHLPIKKYVAD